jgi:hypothetical protein
MSAGKLDGRKTRRREGGREEEREVLSWHCM